MVSCRCRNTAASSARLLLQSLPAPLPWRTAFTERMNHSTSDKMCAVYGVLYSSCTYCCTYSVVHSTRRHGPHDAATEGSQPNEIRFHRYIKVQVRYQRVGMVRIVQGRRSVRVEGGSVQMSPFDMTSRPQRNIQSPETCTVTIIAAIIKRDDETD